MFVEYATTIDSGLSKVEKRLDALRSNVAEWADIAYRDGEQLRAKVGPTSGVAREVNLEIGVAEIHSIGLVYPIHWTASGATLLFPEMNADLILSTAGSDRTSLIFRGTYDPPLGAVGWLADRAGLRRVADATVANWVDRLAVALSADSVAT
ncbi:MAG: hypothetical protein ACLFRT_00575 [Actinomycetota bacterium]